MTEVERLKLTSTNIAEEKREQLKALFPEAFTEGQKIDFDRLKLTLGEMVDPGKERYGMNWPGKADCFKIIQQPSIATLTPVRDESVDFDTTENLFIEGDNLEVLKLLQKSYFGKVKMIEIDPPYNTGNDFIYPDDYSESLDTYLRYTGQIDNEGRKYSTNTEADGRFHSKWMNMMYPRLFLSRNLLREDGVIFIHIDDTELSNLRKLCDEIFGEGNFVEQIIWKKRSTPPNDQIIGAIHDYVLIYCKSQESVDLNLKKRTDKQIERYKNPDNHPKGPWTPGDLMANVKGGRYVKSLFFPIVNPLTGEEHYPSSNGNWRFNKDKVEDLIKNNEIYFGDDGKSRPKLKRFLRDVKEGITYSTMWDFVPLNQAGSREMTELLGNMNIFDNPKPSGLLSEIIKLGAQKDSSHIIIDFFGGSASTAHATLDLNKEDGGNRKFIIVQLPEPTDEDSEARKAGYKTIADIGKERIRRVIKKIKGELEKKKDLLSGDKPQQDLGFKVFKLQPSNFKLWNGDVAKDKEAIEAQLEMFVDHINPKSSQEDILYELLLKSGFPLTTKIEKITLAEKTVFSIADGSMFICLEKELTPEVIKAMADQKPVRVVCLDEGFKGNDQLKTNAVQIMKSRNITFRTV